MSCHHRYYPHGCGDWPAPPPEWYDAYGYRPRRYRDDVVVLRDDDLDDIVERRPRRRRGGDQRLRRPADDMVTNEITAASLQSRAETLRDELVRIEEELARRSAGPSQGSET